MRYVFEEYELDDRRYELRYAGKAVKLEPQVVNMLAYLIQHRDRVVTQEELFAQLWPGRFISEATLTSRLTAARRAIGDRGREQRLIQTVHGRGYRFIAAVEECHEQLAAGLLSAPSLTPASSKAGASRPEASAGQAERFYEADLQRLKGELLLRKYGGAGFTTGHAAGAGAGGQSTPRLEAEACFEKALDIARRQGAKSLELRAAMSLSRLWQHQGERDKARALLAPIYAWFTEGFDTANLQEAEALLGELS
jgi:DNA-binding winged helix-turn-helix (wHTH) protein